MKVGNLLFSTPMVRAILREIEQPGTGKTQTRRALTRARVFATPERPAFTISGNDMVRALQNADRFRRLSDQAGEDGWYWEADAFEWQAPATRTGWLAHIGFAPGDLLYVREAWRTESRAYDDLAPADMDADYPVLYDAGADWSLNKSTGRARASMHMPRWASRLTLEVTDIRIQRLQEISEEDATAEGAWLWREENDPAGVIDHPRDAYCHLWDEINGDRPGLAWRCNPWVVAITFRPHLINIDKFLERSEP